MMSPSEQASRVSRRSLTAGLLFVALAIAVPGYAPAQTGQAVSPAALVEKLKSGGYNIYVRHAATDWSQSDKIAERADISSCDGSQVRQLSETGRQAARETGVALKALGIGIGEVYSSPYCRSADTARLMSGKEPQLTDDLMNLRSASYVGGREALVARTRKRLSQPPSHGVNALYSAHGNLGRAATGEFLGEGELLIVLPRDNGGFAIEGRLKPGDLEKLVGR